MNVMKLELQNLIETLADNYYILMIDSNGTILSVNEPFLTLIESDKDEILGLSYKKIGLAPESMQKLENAIRSQQSNYFNLQLSEKSKNNKSLKVLVTPVQGHLDNKPRYLLFAHDISEFKRLKGSTKDALKQLIDIKNALDQSSIIAITDENGVINYVNDKFCEISQFSKEEIIGKSHRLVNSNYHEKSFIKNLWDTIKSGETWEGEIRNKAKDGSYYWVKTFIVPFFNEEGIISQYISIRTDITSRIEAEEKLALTMENNFNTVVQNVQNGVFRLSKLNNHDIIFTLSEGVLIKELGYDSSITKNKTVYDLFSAETAEILHYHFTKAFENKDTNFEIPFYTTERKYFFYITLSPIIDGDKVTEVIGSVIDITQRKLYENKIQHLAHYDSLTNLMNRTYFDELLSDYIDQVKLTKSIFSILLIDLDRFKNVNDIFGHSTGDEMLRDIAKYLQSNIKFEDIISRQGSDEFAIVLKGVNRIEAGNIAERIIRNIRKALEHYRVGFSITLSIGIGVYPDDGEIEDDLMKAAYTALSLAKRLGKNNYQYFTKELHEFNLKKVKIEADLRKALIHNELELYYQPKMQLKENKLTGFEALLRWNHQDLGIVPPNEFIKISEETGLIVPIGEWIIHTACQQLKKWHNAGYTDLTMAVNISFRQFIQGDLHMIVRRALREENLEPKYLELEITESVSMEPNYAMMNINKLKDIGVKVSIDDFGTGYSSLNYLSKLNVDCLKIDRSFLANLNESNKTIIKTIIILAKNLDIEVIAEGIEEEDHIQFLIKENCFEGQGFYYCKPLPVRKLESWLKTNRHLK